MKKIYGVSNHGNMGYRYATTGLEEVTIRRRQFCADLQVDPDRVICANVKMGRDIIVAEPKYLGHLFEYPSTLPGADLIFLPEPGTFAMINPADCIIVTFFDDVLYRVMHIHEGFVSVQNETAKTGLRYILEQGSALENLSVHFGPALQTEHFLVPADYVQSNMGWGPYLSESGNAELPVRVDFVQRAFDQLIELGISAEKILRDRRDTYTDPTLFSHARSNCEGLPQARFSVLAGFQE